MNPKRLFIAINLPENIKKEIEKIVSDFKISINQRENLGKSAAEIRFLQRGNWHLTISFLGNQPEEKNDDIINSIKQTVLALSYRIAPEVKFDKIILGPPNKPSRMIWLTIAKETSQILGGIKKELENNLMKNGVIFKRENREYNGHITLAKFNSLKLSSASIINKKLLDISHPRIKNLSFNVNNLDLVESHLKRVGSEYEILSSIKFDFFI